MNSHRAQARSKRPRMTRLAIAGAALVAGLAASMAALPSSAGAAGGVTVKLVSHGSLGKILVNSAGMTVYVYTADLANKPTCTGACASAWPPVTVPKGTKVKGGPGVTELGTVSSGGKLQVTWNKHPLYTYALDTGPGVVNGNGVQEGSGTWFAATAKHAGAASTTAKSAPSSGYGY